MRVIDFIQIILQAGIVILVCRDIYLFTKKSPKFNLEKLWAKVIFTWAITILYSIFSDMS